MNKKLLITASAIAIAAATFGSASAVDVGAINDVTMEERQYQGSSGSNMDIISSLWIGGAAIDSSSSAYDGDSLFKIGGDTRVNIGPADGFSLQLEGLGSFSGFTYDDGNDDEEALLNFQAGAHVIHRNSDSYAAGAFVSFSGTSFVDDSEDSGHIIAGGELAGFFGNTTLVVQAAGAWDLLESDDGWDDGWFVRGVGRYFVTPNSKIEGEVAYVGGKFDCCGGGDEYAVTWGLEYEQQFGPMPMSGFAAYDGTYIDESGGDFTENRFVVGLRARFGETDMLAQDRGGAGTFDLYDVANISGIPDDL
jgi:hypothetical protein